MRTHSTTRADLCNISATDGGIRFPPISVGWFLSLSNSCSRGINRWRHGCALVLIKYRALPNLVLCTEESPDAAAHRCLHTSVPMESFSVLCRVSFLEKITSMVAQQKLWTWTLRRVICSPFPVFHQFFWAIRARYLRCSVSVLE